MSGYELSGAIPQPLTLFIYAVREYFLRTTKMLDEIKKAQQMAIDLKLEAIVENIVTNAGRMPNATKAEWEGCQLVIEHKPSNAGESFSIVMPNGLVLYKAQRDNWGEVTVTDFRYGSWVQKIKAHSEQINLSPFSAISDDEFEASKVDNLLF